MKITRLKCSHCLGAKGSFKMAERSTRRVVAPPLPPAASVGGTDFGELD